MAYGIMRMSKVKMSGVTGIQIHNLRQKDHSNTNPDIDWSKTKDNCEIYSVNNHSQNFKKAIQERIDQLDLKRKPRKDATVMVDVLVTASPDFFEGDKYQEKTMDYFHRAYEQIGERFGWDNIISAEVHFDEATPHMHLDFVPITKDGRLSAKDLLGSPKDFQKLQDWFHESVSSSFDLERGETRKGEKPKKHMEMLDYKIATKEEEYNDIHARSKEAELDLKCTSVTLQELHTDVLTQQDNLQNLELEMERLEGEKRKLEKYKEKIFEDVKVIEGKRSAMNMSKKECDKLVHDIQDQSKPTILNKDSYTIPKSLLNKVIDLVKSIPALASENKKLSSQIKLAVEIQRKESEILKRAEEKADSIIKSAEGKSVKMTLQQAKAEADRQNAMRKYEKFMDAHPNIKEQFERENRGNHFRNEHDHSRSR